MQAAYRLRVEGHLDQPSRWLFTLADVPDSTDAGALTRLKLAISSPGAIGTAASRRPPERACESRY
jgi:hypothetical protein